MRLDIDLHIERLVLEGVAPADRDRVGEALRRELTRLLTERGVPTALRSGRVAPTLDLGTLPPSPLQGANEPQTLGAQIARRVYAGLGGRDEPVRSASPGRRGGLEADVGSDPATASWREVEP
jgi:hypothetical protein